EVFWYGCPHCYNFEAYVKKWLETKPSYVNFIRIPAVWNPRLKMHARAFYTAQVLGKGDAMHDAFFKEIHVNQNLLDTEDKLAEFFGRFGVDKAAFEKTFNSYAVQEKMQRADELNRRYRIMNVPSMVVNGKYMTNGAMAGSYQGMLDLVDELVASEHIGEEGDTDSAKRTGKTETTSATKTSETPAADAAPAATPPVSATPAPTAEEAGR
ncbi:MAG TPA: thiol:disulfide interchange protein DsbA/DsbL, partial [Gammaproteobacteria bacterium]|nr:thiol:disulfide interchange protein DsbA/DsbL [Gammaproteobacteria bacterium]